jgi:glycosyltransferase domain-containing protein
MGRNLGIIIPTKNRFDWAITRLRFHLNSGFEGYLFFVDSSFEDNTVRFQSEISHIGARNVHYAHIPNLGAHQAILEGLKLCIQHCEYAVFSGDDDFHIPTGVNKATAFLDRHPEFVAAMGHSITILMDLCPEKSKIHSVSRYWNRPEFLQETPINRLNRICSSYVNLEFAIKRTDKYLEIMEGVVDHFPDHGFAGSRALELSTSLALALDGKVKYINAPFLIRGDHHGRLNSHGGEDYRKVQKNSIEEDDPVSMFLQARLESSENFTHKLDIKSALNQYHSEKFFNQINTRGESYIQIYRKKIRNRLVSTILKLRYQKVLRLLSQSLA